MSKKQLSLQATIKIAMTLLFMLAICTPGIVMLLFGSRETPLESEKEVTLKDVTVNRYFNGDFQSNFESWFSTHYPMRGNFVLFYRQLKFDVDNLKLFPTLPQQQAEKPPIDIIETPQTTPAETEEINEYAPRVMGYFDEDNPYREINLKQYNEAAVEPSGFKGSDAVLIGKSGYLFESAYINEFYGYSHPYNAVPDEGLVELVDKLTYIQDQLAKRGITLVLNLSSSKASQYEAYIPEWYKNTQYAADDYVRPYTRLQKLLAESEINYIDSSELFKRIGLLATFPKTGIHWNHLASFESTSATIDKYIEVSGNVTKRLTLGGIEKLDRAPSFGNSDVDIYNILYGTVDKSNSIVDDEYYAPEIIVENKDAESIGILLHGGSFSTDIAYYLRSNKIARPLRQFNYNNFMGSKKNSPYGELGLNAWDRLLEDIDLVIFEMTEQQVRGHFPSREGILENQGNSTMGHLVTYASLYYYLKDNEIQ